MTKTDFLNSRAEFYRSRGEDYTDSYTWAAQDMKAEYDLAREESDLLDLVDEKEVLDLRTPGQIKFMSDLIEQISALDPATGEKARDYTDRMTEAGKWTPGREGNASDWISRMLDKLKVLKTAPAAPAPSTEIPDGIYAIEDGETKCYRVKNGYKPGFLFLDRVSSDDRFPIRNPAEKNWVLAAIRADVEAAGILAAHTLKQCRRCSRTLTDTKNPYYPIGMGPDCGAK